MCGGQRVRPFRTRAIGPHDHLGHGLNVVEGFPDRVPRTCAASAGVGISTITGGRYGDFPDAERRCIDAFGDANWYRDFAEFYG